MANPTQKKMSWDVLQCVSKHCYAVSYDEDARRTFSWWAVVPVHTYITNPLGHVARLTNLALIRCAFCGAFSMNGKPKAGIVFKMADVGAGVVDVGQSLKRRVCSESSALLNTVSLDTHTQKQEWTVVRVWQVLNMHGCFSHMLWHETSWISKMERRFVSLLVLWCRRLKWRFYIKPHLSIKVNKTVLTCVVVFMVDVQDKSFSRNMWQIVHLLKSICFFLFSLIYIWSFIFSFVYPLCLCHNKPVSPGSKPQLYTKVHVESWF